MRIVKGEIKRKYLIVVIGEKHEQKYEKNI